MARKVRRNISIPQGVDEYLAREGVNASGLITDLVQQHKNATGDSVETTVQEERAIAYTQEVIEIADSQIPLREEEVRPRSNVDYGAENLAIKNKAANLDTQAETLVEAVQMYEESGEIIPLTQLEANNNE